MDRNALFKKLRSTLHNSGPKTWFDMGLFLDQIRDNQDRPGDLPKTFKQFKTQLRQGIAFLTFDFGIDGVSVEVSKYSEAIKKLFDLDPTKDSHRIHWIAGDFKEGHESFGDEWKRFKLIGGGGF